MSELTKLFGHDAFLWAWQQGYFEIAKPLSPDSTYSTSKYAIQNYWQECQIIYICINLGACQNLLLGGGWVVVVGGGGVEVRSGGDVDAGVCVCVCL